MSAPLVLVQRSEGMCRLGLNRPPVNVLTMAMVRELDEQLCRVAEDPGVKVVLLEGHGRAFCAGVDVADHVQDRVGEMLQVFHAVIRRLGGMPQPIVAALHGATLGGGLELALACDIVVASADARLGQPEIKLGVFPPAAAALLPRIIGRQNALDLILTGRAVSAADALSLGLVSHVWPAEEFAAEVDAYVQGLATLSGTALRFAKRALIGGLDAPTDEALARAEHLYLAELMHEPDAHEGIAAFMEKRQPVWAS